MSQVLESPRDSEMAADLLRARELSEVALLDYKRNLKVAAKQMTQKQIAEIVRLSQPAIATALKRAAKVPDAIAGFKAASPHEVCQRYAAGLISRKEVVRQLVAWPYNDTPKFNEFGEVQGDTSGTFTDVENAVMFGLIDDSIYEEVFNQLAD
ncbi:MULTISPECIES: hypothetical protein [Micrococcaceae]|uniref:Uncharacterized protein n=2 Tax=Pseudoglutamicibacter albus TaxID=98671 RepID=A0A095YDI0_9MICC|nr:MULTISPECIES: hypothetical protein [Micrococcaceae]KGF20505.1 hypothetical protein HMPREF2128_05410 [Pseudoglutamicibacter albus DNF00011]MDR7294468.1 hypothetical protein [Pseudoglutamicibacter albus]OFT22994.1 hypothetical protein HMPREF3175_05960 [Arthrobacter sp. HMSC08H08]OFT42153.1 hypothetical protein HMPREF3160_05235 [Arthrobacter sp. HMSC06H05]